MTHRKSISTRERFRIFARDGFRCQYCGLSAPDVALQVDHVDPVANGGAHHESNFITACSYCNAGKSDMSGIAELIDQKLMDRFEGGYEMYVEHPDDYGTARIHQFSGRECGDAVEPVGIDFDIESAASELPSALFAPVEVGTWEAF